MNVENNMEESKIKLKSYNIPRLRLALIQKSYVNSPIKRITKSRELAESFHAQLYDGNREVFLASHFDRKNQIIEIHHARVASLSSSIVSLRKIWC